MSGREERDEEKIQKLTPDLAKQHDCVKRNTDNTAARPKDSDISIWKLFKYADSLDLWLMAFGTVGTITDGLTMPVMLLILSSLIDKIGKFSSISTRDFPHTISTVIIISFRQQNLA